MVLVKDKKGILKAMEEKPDAIRRVWVREGYERVCNDIITEAKAKGIPFKIIRGDEFVRRFKNSSSPVFLEEDAVSFINPDEFLNRITHLQNPLLCAFDGIYDPQNLGNIVRSAASLDVDGLILPGNRSCSINETVIRIAKGGVHHVHIIRVTNIPRYIEAMKNKNIFCFGLDERGTRSVWDVDLTGSVCLVFGKEDGLRRLTKERCDDILKIPTSHDFPSLNVATSVAITLYEARRQRMGQNNTRYRMH